MSKLSVQGTKRMLGMVGTIVAVIMFVFYMFSLSPLICNRMYPVFVLFFLYDAVYVSVIHKGESQLRQYIMALLSFLLVFIGFFTVQPLSFLVVIASIICFFLFFLIVVGDILHYATWLEIKETIDAQLNKKPEESDEEKAKRNMEEMQTYIAKRKEALNRSRADVSAVTPNAVDVFSENPDEPNPFEESQVLPETSEENLEDTNYKEPDGEPSVSENVISPDNEGVAAEEIAPSLENDQPQADNAEVTDE